MNERDVELATELLKALRRWIGQAALRAALISWWMDEYTATSDDPEVAALDLSEALWDDELEEFFDGWSP